MQEVLRWWLCAANKHVIFSSTCLLDKKNSKATEMRIYLRTATYSHIQNYCINKKMSTYYMVFTAGKLFLNSAAVKI